MARQKQRKQTKRKLERGSSQFPTPEAIRGVGTSFRRNDFWNLLDGQTLAMIGPWYSRQPLTNHKQYLSTQTIPNIVAPKACIQSPKSFWSGEYWRSFACQFAYPCDAPHNPEL